MQIFTILNFGIAILALGIAGITAWWQFFRKPSLSIQYIDKSPFRKRLLPSNQNNPAWFVRVRVKNNSRVIAKNCFGKIVEWHTDYKMDENFDPVKLHWVSNSLDDYSGINLAYQEFDFIDLFFTKEDKDILLIYTNTHPRGTPPYFNLNKEHLIKLAVYCENEVSIFKYFRIVPEKDAFLLSVKMLTAKEATHFIENISSIT